MSSSDIVILGAIAGLTIFIGLPVGRMQASALGLRAFLNATATGVLAFLFVDVLGHGLEPIDTALGNARAGKGWGSAAALVAILVVGLAVGLLSLVYYDRWMAARRTRFGPGAASVAEFTTNRAPISSTSRRLALLIAIGIGLHNFAEGLAIGQSAANGELQLAVLLVIGFGLHNATEGFGIVAPMAAEAARPSWGFLATLGLIGGGPTFLGTLVGRSFVDDHLYVGFLALAAGSILYVVVQLVGVAIRMGRKQQLYWGLLVGLVAGLATDFIVTYAGG